MEDTAQRFLKGTYSNQQSSLTRYGSHTIRDIRNFTSNDSNVKVLLRSNQRLPLHFHPSVICHTLLYRIRCCLRNPRDLKHILRRWILRVDRHRTPLGSPCLRHIVTFLRHDGDGVGKHNNVGNNSVARRPRFHKITASKARVIRAPP